MGEVIHISEVIPDDVPDWAREAMDRCEFFRTAIDMGEAVKFLLSFAPDKPPKGLDPTFYHTLSYGGDAELYERVEEIKTLFDQPT
ncbi:MAG: hypothetical protein V3V85_06730 [Candidatus Thorarchaeota archaeon]